MEDELIIRKIVIAIESAWNSHDMTAYGRLLHEDIVWINIVGMHRRGCECVVTAHTAFHETMFKNHNIKTDSIEIHPIAEEILTGLFLATSAFTTT